MKITENKLNSRYFLWKQAVISIYLGCLYDNLNIIKNYTIIINLFNIFIIIIINRYFLNDSIYK